jgi:hypothetical protein
MDDPLNCGSCGNDCSQPNAVVDCNGTRCVNSCGNTLDLCPSDTASTGVANCGSWNFDFAANNLEGWVVTEGLPDGKIDDVSLSTKRKLSDPHSLAIHLPVDSAQGAVANVPLCISGSSVDLTGKALRFAVFFENDSGKTSPNGGGVILRMDATQNRGSSGIDKYFNLATGTWHTYTADIEFAFRHITEDPPLWKAALRIGLSAFSLDPDTWSGTIYLDDFEIVDSP